MTSAFGIEHVSKNAPIGFGGLPTAYARTAVQTARNAPKTVKGLQGSAKLGKAGRLKRREELGRNFKATGGRPEQSESRPGPWLPSSRKAWDRGYHSG